jgi:nicotinate phosphoribosyltransferase
MAQSLLDTDLYKFTMQRAFFYRFSDVVGEYRFRCRTPDIEFTDEMVEAINFQLDALCDLRFTDEEIRYLAAIPYMTRAVGYHEFLRFFRLNRDFIEVHLSRSAGLEIIAKGPLWAVSPFEIYVLEIVNEVYYRCFLKNDYDETLNVANVKLDEKIAEFIKSPFPLLEFGTRRRFSGAWQEWVLKSLAAKAGDSFIGTSNVMLAKKLGLKPQGTFAHEYVCVPQGLNDCSLRNSQRYAWDQWCREYRGDIGCCLTDTLGQEKFEQDFDRYWANMFTSLRHDSGDPIEWGERAISIYEGFGIDPRTKTLVFSDSLSFNTARYINERFKDRTRCVFGIGTFLTNDTSTQPLNIVMKLVKVNNRPVAKLSNVDGKQMCIDSSFVDRLREEIK